MEEVWLYFYFFVFSSFKHRVKSILTQIDSNRFFYHFFPTFFSFSGRPKPFFIPWNKAIVNQIDFQKFRKNLKFFETLKIHHFRNSKDFSEIPVRNSGKSSDFYNFARARQYVLKIREFGLKR